MLFFRLKRCHPSESQSRWRVLPNLEMAFFLPVAMIGMDAKGLIVYIKGDGCSGKHCQDCLCTSPLVLDTATLVTADDVCNYS